MCKQRYTKLLIRLEVGGDAMNGDELIGYQIDLMLLSCVLCYTINNNNNNNNIIIIIIIIIIVIIIIISP